jgi:hypothetical protein
MGRRYERGFQLCRSKTPVGMQIFLGNSYRQQKYQISAKDSPYERKLHTPWIDEEDFSTSSL